MFATITTKGNITIPKKIRKRLQLDTGDRVEFIIDDDGKLFLLPITRDVKTLKGMLPKPHRALSLEAMNMDIDTVSTEAEARY